MQSNTSLAELMANLPQQGTVSWIGIRTAKKMPLQSLQQVDINQNGLAGDHYAGRSGKRSVTLIQAEHLAAVASMLHQDNLEPELVRRNIVIRGINLLALKDRVFKLGTAELAMTGLCHPCSRMEQVLGAGGYNAMRGHGGINARVVKPGKVSVGDHLVVL